MKLSNALLALCAYPIVGTTGFLAPAPKTASTTELYNSLRAYEARVDQLEREQVYGGRRGQVGPYQRQNYGYGSSNGRGAGGFPGELEIVQGGSLKTWSFEDDYTESVQVSLETEGRPLEALVELWQGPDNTPHKLKVYSEDGFVRPFQCVLDTPSSPNTICVRNQAQLEFPLVARVMENGMGGSYQPSASMKAMDMMEPPRTIQGGSLKTFDFDTSVESVQVLMETDGRPLNARVELLQGPNNKKQVIEIYTDDGNYRPFYIILDTPGSGNVVRIVNTATVEFPMTAWVEPYTFGDRGYSPNAQYRSQYNQGSYGGYGRGGGRW